jgi:hypothetical protein
MFINDSTVAGALLEYLTSSVTGPSPHSGAVVPRFNAFTPRCTRRLQFRRASRGQAHRGKPARVSGIAAGFSRTRLEKLI